MGKFDGCLLVSDIDGTLFYKDSIPKVNLEKLKYYMDNGGKFAIATGRAYLPVQQILRQVPLNSPILVSNGSMIYDSINDEILSAEYMDTRSKELVFALADKFKDISVEVSLPREVITVNDTEDGEWHRNYVEIPLVTMSREELMTKEWSKVIFNSTDKARFKELSDYATDLVGDDYTIMLTSPRLFEINPKGISKAYKMDELKKINGTAEGRLYCIGDYYNDVELIQCADVSAVPNNAPDDLKEMADMVLCDVWDGAVAQLIDYIDKSIT